MDTSKSLGFILWGPSMSVKWTDLRATELVWLLTSLLTNTEVETYGCTCALRPNQAVLCVCRFPSWRVRRPRSVRRTWANCSMRSSSSGRNRTTWSVRCRTWNSESVFSALATKTPHRWTKTFLGSGKYQTVKWVWGRLFNLEQDHF